MKLQYMIVIFIAVVLPICLVLSVYNQFQIKTMNTQVSYDTKLTDATHDAAVALHTNIMNNGSQATIYNVMRENVLAATNIFVNSIATSFGVGGYSEEEIMQHVPALVYTMYDGYYIYTPYKQYDSNESKRTLKTYVYYTERYTDEAQNLDVVVNYTLDNYIAIYGKKRTESISIAGYLIKYEDVNIGADDTVKYKDIVIDREPLKNFNKNFLVQKVEKEGNPPKNKYSYSVESEDLDNELANYLTELANYTEGTSKRDEINKKIDELKSKCRSAQEYYKNAKIFTNDVDEIFSDTKFKEIFNKNIDPENEDSLFYKEKCRVIKKSIEDNLKTAISNFNKTTTGSYNYRIPVLSEEDWNVVLNNFSVISYLQGLPIGFKTYNSYSVCPLASNNLYVNKNDIYYKGSDNDKNKYYHSEDCNKIERRYCWVCGI